MTPTNSSFEFSFTPTRLTVFRGIQIAGEFEDYLASDDSRSIFHPGFTLGTDAPIWLIFESLFPSAVGSEFQLICESHSGTPGIARFTQIWNESEFRYHTIEGLVEESFGIDVVNAVSLPTPIDQYLHNNSLRTRIGWRRVGYTIKFPWDIYIDHVYHNAQFETIPDDPRDICHRW